MGTLAPMTTVYEVTSLSLERFSITSNYVRWIEGERKPPLNNFTFFFTVSKVIKKNIWR